MTSFIMLSSSDYKTLTVAENVYWWPKQATIGELIKLPVYKSVYWCGEYV